MIFENATRLTSKEEFVEKILIYIRLVEVIAERDKIIMPQTPTTSKEVVKELQDMGVIDEEAELTDLKRVIGNEYIRFISSVAFYLTHKQLYGGYLDRLNNKRRKEIQAKEENLFLKKEI